VETGVWTVNIDREKELYSQIEGLRSEVERLRDIIHKTQDYCDVNTDLNYEDSNV